MTARRVFIAVIAVGALALAWVLFIGLPRWYGRTPAGSAAISAPAATPPLPPGRKIKARLFYVSEDGSRLIGVEREVAYGDGPLEQARQIVAAEITPVSDPLVSPIPPGTTLRSLFLTQAGTAYVDLSREVASAHPGGTIDEALTVYAIVDAITANLPAVTAVQLLVDGKQVDTLAGHLDLRHPLAKNVDWIE